MKKTTKLIISLLLTTALLISPVLQLFGGMISFAENTTLFKTSFEENEDAVSGRLIEQSGVVKTAYGIKGKGLEVRLDTVGGSEDYLGSENKYNLFDGKTATKFLTAKNTAVIYFALKAPAAVNAYEIASANDEPTRDPKAWSFYGSTDGKTWTLLDEQSGVSFGARFMSKKYTFSNTTEYTWYKLDVTKNAGAGMIQFSSLELYAEGGEATEQPTVDESSVTATAPYSASHAVDCLFDGNTGTKYLSETGTCTVTFALTKPLKILAYGITVGDDQPKRDPSSFAFYGSTDGETFVKLDEQSGVTFPERKGEKVFNLSGNKNAYLWYRLEVTANGGVDPFGINTVQMSELKVYTKTATVKQDPVPSKVDTSSVSATEHYSSHSADLLFDESASTKYLVYGSQSAVISFKLQSAAAITRYALTNGNDHNERDPKSWDFYGSNNGNDWTKLDSKTDQTFEEACATNVYKFNNTTAYLWYKLEITSVVGPDTWFSKEGNDVYLLHLAEITLYTEENWHEPTGEDPVDEEGEFSVVASSVKGPRTVSGEGVNNLFDRESATKAVFYGSTAWVSFKVNRADTVTAYSITSANDWQQRDPNEWTLYGSNDGENWTAIDERQGVEFSGRYEEKAFRLETPVAYLWYKLDVTKIFGQNDYTQLSDLTLMTAADVPETEEGMTAVKDFGPTQTDTGKPGAWTGASCLAVFGEQSDTANTYARAALFENLSIPVSASTTLSYLIFPGLFNIKTYDYEYTSCRVMPDLHFTDGTCLSQLAAEDQNGSILTPAGQVEGECLVTMQWNYIESLIGKVAAGKTIDRIDVLFSMDAAEDASKFLTFFDDVKIENKEPVVYDHLSDYITILRGTNNDSAFSRGLCTPAVTLPNGFNFYSPVTNPSKATASYNYQQNGENNPLDSITVIHAPSYWLSSYGTWQFMANTSVDASGTVTSAAISSDARKAKFTHDNEIAHAHYYSVTLNEGTAASGVKIEVTPTSHAAYVRFTFPADAQNVNVIFDSLWGSGTLTFSEDGKSFTATTSHNSAGSTKMFVYGVFDTAWNKASAVTTKQGLISFAKGTKTVTMKIATSFLSVEQAKHSMDLEIGSKDFDGVFATAQGEWDALCGKFEIEGATYTQLLNFYSALYRMYAYPNLYSENEGTNENPVWVYASPYKSGKKTSGILYTNNGFWDTFRTTWAGYSLFTSDKDGEMLDGIVQHYIDSGWIPRWICPGGVNCMVGTSSDIIFADAYIKGIDFNYEKAWESMLENASAYSADLGAGGRPDNNLTPFLGYVANSTGEGYSSSIESYINDYGLYRMAEKMGLTAEAEYYCNRCLKYVELFNADAGFFMGKSAKGVFSATRTTYDPTAWGGPKGDYTESVGWVNTFPAVFDPEGLVALYGGREALAAKLNTMFDDSPAAMRKVVTGIGHEICEFKEVKMGQYEHNNQPSHHVIFTYASSSEPWRVQEYTREVLQHVYVGSEIGQGLPGDEDNGEMSAWYVFNALGFYPYCLASGEYVIGSPLFEKVTIHLDNGNDVVIKANNNSRDNVYIQSAKVNGQSYDKLYLTHETLTNGCVIEYEMGSTPNPAFGQSDDARPTSLSSVGTVEEYKKDVTDGAAIDSAAFEAIDYGASAKKIYTGIENASKLFDGNSTTYATITDGASVVFTGAKPSRVSLLTLSCYDKTSAPKGVRIEVTNDGENYRTVYENSDVSFLFGKFVVPYEIPEDLRGKYYVFRVTLSGGTKLSEIELIGEEEDLTISDVTALLDYLALADEEQQRSFDKIFKVDVTKETTISDVTMLLNLLAGMNRA